MYNIPHDLLDGFGAAPAIYTALLAGCTQAQAQAAHGGDEDWSVVAVMCHLRDAEERALERMRAMRDQDDPFLPGFDQDAWAQERNYATGDLHAALAAFLALHAQHLAELAALTPAQWERTGRHEEQGQITITAHTLHLLAHQALHAAQIARQLQGSAH